MAKRYKVNFTKNAQGDLEHIFFYIAEDNINKARKFILELEEKIYSLATFPERFSYIPENAFFGTNYRNLTHKKYRVIYRIDENAVFVLRVIHGAKLLDL